jgi:hypothetical protein
MNIPTQQEIPTVEPESMIPSALILLTFFSIAAIYNGIGKDDEAPLLSRKKDVLLTILGATGLSISAAVFSMLVTGQI